MPDLGEQIAAAAREWIGTPFHWEASLRGEGVDCRGLLTGVARDCGLAEAAEIEARLVGYSLQIDEAELLSGMARLFDIVPLESARIAGDILGFRIQRKIQHLGIYVGSGRMIHAYSGNPGQVVEVPLGLHWSCRVACVWRWRPRSISHAIAPGIS